MPKLKGDAKAKRREQMFRRQKGRCHWCGCAMTLEREEGRRPRLPKNFATFDHLRDRFHPERGDMTAVRLGFPVIVLACWKCNHDRGRESCRLNAEEQRRRSHRPQDLALDRNEDATDIQRRVPHERCPGD